MTQNFGKQVFDKLIEEKRNQLNREVLEATYRAQKKYGFDMKKHKYSYSNTHNNAADAFKHVYSSWYLSYYYGQTVAKWFGDMHENETPNAPFEERNMDLWNNQIGREISIEIKSKYGKNIKYYTKDKISDLASYIIWEKMQRGDLITDPFKDKRLYKNMEKERLSDEDRVFYEDEYWDDMDEKERLRFKEHYAKYKTKIQGKFPSKAVLQAGTLTGDYIYVNNYIRSDGTRVHGYYRRKPYYSYKN